MAEWSTIIYFLTVQWKQENRISWHFNFFIKSFTLLIQSTFAFKMFRNFAFHSSEWERFEMSLFWVADYKFSCKRHFALSFRSFLSALLIRFSVLRIFTIKFTRLANFQQRLTLKQKAFLIIPIFLYCLSTLLWLSKFNFIGQDKEVYLNGRSPISSCAYAWIFNFNFVSEYKGSRNPFCSL